MEFEGVEKKAEIHFQPNCGNLLTDICITFWQQLVHCAGGEILSSIENASCRAYVLSESSLIVWQNHFVILTCGETDLAKALGLFLRLHPNFIVDSLYYSRKTERFPARQPTTFEQDVGLLSIYVKGNCFVLGNAKTQRNKILHYQRSSKEVSNRCFELIAHKLPKNICTELSNKLVNQTDIISLLGLSGLLFDFTLDSVKFDPVGFSLNAIKEDAYLTIHITPQHCCSYVSIVSNICIMGHSQGIVNALNPELFEVVVRAPCQVNYPWPVMDNLKILGSSRLISQGTIYHYTNYIK